MKRAKHSKILQSVEVDLSSRAALIDLKNGIRAFDSIDPLYLTTCLSYGLEATRQREPDPECPHPHS